MTVIEIETTGIEITTIGGTTETTATEVLRNSRMTIHHEMGGRVTSDPKELGKVAILCHREGRGAEVQVRTATGMIVTEINGTETEKATEDEAIFSWSKVALSQCANAWNDRRGTELSCFLVA